MKFRVWLIPLLLALGLAGILPGAWVKIGLLASPASGQPKTIYLPLVEGGSGVVGVSPTSTPTLAPTATSLPAATATATPGISITPTPTSSGGGSDPVLIGAGDIAMCGRPGSAQTAAILAQNPGTVFALGDNAYDSGTPLEYTTCYDPVWGIFKNHTYPVPGNHDYLTLNASGYFGYFGAAAGNPLQGWYSFDLGAWHILAINSNCLFVGGCNTNSPQERWVRADLAAHPAKCTLAMWHHPYYSSGQNGDTTQMAAIWQDLYNAGAELVLSGHDHDYERFAPQDASANLDTARGIVQFVVGVGGSDFTPILYPLQPNSLTQLQNTFGVLKLTLHPSSYSWAFLPVSGSYSDSGTANCH